MFHINKKKGFTLTEMMVVVIIVGILAAFAWPQYVFAIERMRLAEADQMLGNVWRSQQRFKLQTDTKYARYWGVLDMAPGYMRNFPAHTFVTFCTKDAEQPLDGNCEENGFKITLHGATTSQTSAGVVAHRVNNGNFSYKLARLYNDKDVFLCAAGEKYRENDKRICAEFTGGDEYDESAEAKIAGIEQAGL